MRSYDKCRTRCIPGFFLFFSFLLSFSFWTPPPSSFPSIDVRLDREAHCFSRRTSESSHVTRRCIVSRFHVRCGRSCVISHATSRVVLLRHRTRSKRRLSETTDQKEREKNRHAIVARARSGACNERSCVCIV